MKLLRNEAIDILSYLELIDLGDIKREEILMELKGDLFEQTKDYNLPKYNLGIFEYLKNEFKGVINSYIELQINNLLNKNVVVIGEVDDLYSCPCCNYKTLDRIGEYDICKVCYWEDDGIRELDRYSSVNHMSLSEAIENYRKIGVISDRFLQFVHDERFKMFEKEN